MSAPRVPAGRGKAAGRRLSRRILRRLDAAAGAVIRFLVLDLPHGARLARSEAARLPAWIARLLSSAATADAVVLEAALRFRSGLVGLDSPYLIQARMDDGAPKITIYGPTGPGEQPHEAARRSFGPAMRRLAAYAPRGFFEVAGLAPGREGAMLQAFITTRCTGLFLTLDDVTIGWYRSVPDGGGVEIRAVAGFNPPVELSAHDRTALARDFLSVVRKIPRLAAVLDFGVRPREVRCGEDGMAECMSLEPTADVIGRVLAAARGEGGADLQRHVRPA